MILNHTGITLVGLIVVLEFTTDDYCIYLLLLILQLMEQTDLSTICIKLLMAVEIFLNPSLVHIFTIIVATASKFHHRYG